ncbi:DUF4160 domain-containing protein [Limnohabitans sp.]|jgi:hypothetical protein|uniref:DUF4160 domain-containing protein n=1 Tax=Limnohabitans sp. TaxID=1907725 RepID=UPI0037C13C99
MSCIRSNGLRLVVYPNDHSPPHAHVHGSGWEIRIELSMPPALMTIMGKPKVAEVTAALMAVDAHLKQLRTHWSQLHD